MFDSPLFAAAGIGYHVLVVTMVCTVIYRKREAGAAIGWSLAIVFLPILGMTAFVLFGIPKIPRRLRKKVAHRQHFSRRFRATRSGPAAPASTGWDGLARLAHHLGEAPPREGNDVDLLLRGERAFAEIFAAIAQAKHHVHIESFILRDDGLGRELIDLLVKRVREGVEVRLIVDAVGSVGAHRLIRRLRQSGGHGTVFMPVIAFGKRFIPNLRNHRKIVVCDGNVGFFGGLNIGEEYLGRRKKKRHWCDAHMRVSGPAVADLQRVFAEDWDFAAGEFLSGAAYFPDPQTTGNASVQIISGGPDQDVNAIRQTYFAALARARKSLFIASPYLVPDAGLRDALMNAALRGIDVVLLTQAWPPDHLLPHFAARYYWEDLMGAGVRIFEYTAGMMHAKIVIADDAWASVGSANLDSRSLVLNFEVVGTFDDPEVVQTIAERFEQEELACAREVDPAAFRERRWIRRPVEVVAHLFSPLL